MLQHNSCSVIETIIQAQDISSILLLHEVSQDNHTIKQSYNHVSILHVHMPSDIFFSKMMMTSNSQNSLVLAKIPENMTQTNKGKIQ